MVKKYYYKLNFTKFLMIIEIRKILVKFLSGFGILWGVTHVSF